MSNNALKITIRLVGKCLDVCVFVTGPKKGNQFAVGFQVPVFDFSSSFMARDGESIWCRLPVFNFAWAFSGPGKGNQFGVGFLPLIIPRCFRARDEEPIWCRLPVFYVAWDCLRARGGRFCYAFVFYIYIYTHYMFSHRPNSVYDSCLIQSQPKLHSTFHGRHYSACTLYMYL
jgi:hypothetical protein